jgi:RNA polymerase sigma factor (sigma-70 family)
MQNGLVRMHEIDGIPQEALQEELENLHNASFGWALACCGWSREDAEDVLQMTYLKILEGKARFKQESSLKTWLFALIRNTAGENRRRDFLQQLHLSKFLNKQTFKLISSSAMETDTWDLRQRFVALLNSLPRRQREILALVFYSDLTIEEAAKVMNISLGTARTHYERGKRQLRSKLERKELR